MRFIAFMLKMPLLHSSKLSLGKIIVLLAAILIALQLFHMCLLTRLESRDTEKVVPPSVRKSDFIQVVDGMIRKILGSYVLDRGGSYQIISNLLPATNSERSQSDLSLDVTIATQTSSNHLDHLIELSRVWRGPISVAVFTHDSDALYAMYMLAYLHLCHPSVAEWTTFHLAYPLTNPPKSLQNIKVDNFSCDDKNVMPFRTNENENYAIENIEYPHNLLRNLAIQSSKTGFIFVIDVDMIPSQHLRHNFTNFLTRHHDKSDHPSVFVVPAFESKSSAIIPQNKKELVRQWNSGNIRPFYSDVCWKCQKYTNYEEWRIDSVVEMLDVAFFVDWKDPWEPFYISSKSLPLYDERFKQYGFNRISQICELHVAGYKFGVLNNAFLVHKGFKTTDNFHKSKNKEQERNRLLFRQYKEELKTKYSKSRRRCY